MLARVICVLAVSSSSALQIGVPQGRRAFLSQLAAAGTLAASPLAAQAISARTGLSSPFTGEYDDKNHPGCLRSMCGMFEVHHLASATAPPRVRALGFACTGGAPPQAFQLAWHRCQLRPRSLTSQLPTIRREGGGREARRLWPQGPAARVRQGCGWPPSQLEDLPQGPEARAGRCVELQRQGVG